MRKKATRPVRETQLDDFEEKMKDNFLLDFKIKRPALLTVKIRNQVDLKVFLVGSIDSQK